MHESAPILQAFSRDKLGSRYAKRMRGLGKLPAVIYGHKAEPVAIMLDFKEAVEHFENGEKVFRLDFPGKTNKDEMQMVLLKDLQFDYTGNAIVHADMARVDLNEIIRTRVAIHLTGDAKGLKIAGTILIHPANEIIIECAVKDIPEFLNVDVTDLDMDESITADKVKLPMANMKLITDGHAVVAQIIEQREIVTAEASTVAAGAAEPEAAAAGAKAGAAPAAGAKPAGGAAGAKPAAGAKSAGGAKPAAGAAAKPAAKPAAKK